jgi:tetratricopeptide (TPR) repeat protein
LIERFVGFLRGAALCAALAASACASHSDKTQAFRTALDAGQNKQALAEVNDMLDVDSAKELPEEVGGDNALLLLDRSMVLQAIDDYKLSSRDLEISDKQIEVLDFSRNAAHDIGKYLFSDDVGPYKAPAYEKMMINTMNMVNYLARGDLQGARVEARRLAIMQKYLGEAEGRGHALLGLGSYLAGFTFEKSGDPDEAMRYYDEALAYGDYPSLREPIRRLAQQVGYRTPRIRKILGEPEPPTSAAPAPAPKPAAAAATATKPATNPASAATPATGTAPAGTAAATAAPPATATAAPPAPAPSPTTKPAPTPLPPPADDDSAEVLVIVSYGRVPAKVAKRVPIGLALTYATLWMSPANAATANRLAAQGLVTWINYPELGKPRGTYDNPSVSLGSEWVQLEGALAVDLEARAAWEDAKGPIMAAAIVRMITRIVAGEALRRSAKDSTVGAILSLGTQAALVAADTPDTRSWETLPARVAIGRVRVRPGQHRVVLTSRGLKKNQTLTLKPKGWAVAGITVLR